MPKSKPKLSVKTKLSKKKKKQVSQSRPSSPSLGRKILSGLGSGLGGLLGSSSAGRSVGNFIADVTGMGTYHVRSNVLGLSPDDVPHFNNTSGDTVVSHSELITDVFSSDIFRSQAFSVNPTDPATFPWLSAIASSFEQYEFLGLLFCYKPTSGNAIASTNNALGTVVMATEYDVSRPLFSNKADMESYEFSNSFEPCLSAIHPVECNPKADIINSRYTSSGHRQQTASTYIPYVGSSANGQNLASNLTDLGRFQMGVVGMQAVGITVGELWVTYKVRLMKPRMNRLTNRASLFHAGTGPIAGGKCTSGGAFLTLTSGLPIPISSDSTQSFQYFSLIANAIYLGPLPPKTNIELIVRIATSDSTAITVGPTITGVNLTPTGGYFFSPESGGIGESNFGLTDAGGRYTNSFLWITNDDSYITLPYITFSPITTFSGGTYDVDIILTVRNSFDGNVSNLSESAEMRFQNLEQIIRNLTLSTLKEEERKENVENVSVASEYAEVINPLSSAVAANVDRRGCPRSPGPTGGGDPSSPQLTNTNHAKVG